MVNWKVLLTLVVAAVAWRLFGPANLAIVEGASMEPTLHSGQLLVLEKPFADPIRRGDVVAFHHGKDVYIKRVIGLPGDAFWVLDDGEGGNADLVAPRRVPGIQHMLARFSGYGHLKHEVVPSGGLFVVGDHAEVSYDSRYFGPIRAKDVVGRAVVL